MGLLALCCPAQAQPPNALQVARNQIWREHCRKEASQLKSSANFSVPNPSKMHILPPKPNRTVPKFVKQTDGQHMLEATKLLQTICNAKHTHEVSAGQQLL